MNYLLDVEHHWVCPNCTTMKITRGDKTRIPFHPCSGMRGLSAPMVVEGTKCKVEAHEREDYINGEIVQTDKLGRPIQNVITTRDEGQDCAVYAPTATVGTRSEMSSTGKSGKNVSVGAWSAAVKGGSS
jgi:hypothetical protein